MSPNDIKFYHSGGSMNNNPEYDLGGAVSMDQLSSVALNNLFDQVKRQQTDNQTYIDYRCFYIFNGNLTDTLYDAAMYVASERPGGSYIDVGVNVQNEIQTIVFSGTPWEGDSVLLNVDGNVVEIDYYLNTTEWQGEFQTKLRGFEHLQDVIVTVSGVVPTVTFTVNFVGRACCRAYNLISVIDNNLHSTSVTIVEKEIGTPINSVAQTIATKIQAPSGIQWSYPLQGDPVYLGDLRPLEGFPVWIRRTTPQGTTIGIADNFIINLGGFSAPSSNSSSSSA